MYILYGETSSMMEMSSIDINFLREKHLQKTLHQLGTNADNHNNLL